MSRGISGPGHRPIGVNGAYVVGEAQIADLMVRYLPSAQADFSHCLKATPGHGTFKSNAERQRFGWDAVFTHAPSIGYSSRETRRMWEIGRYAVDCIRGEGISDLD